MSQPERAVIGVDVGTGSVRAGVFRLDGTLLGTTATPIKEWRPRPDFFEQSTDDIWAATGTSVRAALAQAGVRPRDVVGLSFDATCSLAALDKQGRPLSIVEDGAPERNVIQQTGHRPLPKVRRYVLEGSLFLESAAAGVGL